MEGDRAGAGRGIIPRAIDEVFAFIENDAAPRSKYLVRAAFLQIYNEVRDRSCACACHMVQSPASAAQAQMKCLTPAVNCHRQYESSYIASTCPGQPCQYTQMLRRIRVQGHQGARR